MLSHARLGPHEYELSLVALHGACAAALMAVEDFQLSHSPKKQESNQPPSTSLRD